MKKFIFIMGLTSLSLLSNSQSQAPTLWWKLDGSNNASSISALGTANNEPLRLKSNGTEWMQISPNGEIFLHRYTAPLNALLGVKDDGLIYKIDYTGNHSDVLHGDGTFGPFSGLTGWNVINNIIYSDLNKNVGIGSNIAPEKLTVGGNILTSGNILAAGSISGTSLNVIDIVTSGKEFKISTSLCMKGIDQNTPGSRNELCGMNGDLFIQSEHNNNYNTVLAYGNGSKVGIGVIPTEDFHVGVKARFDTEFKLTNLNINPNITEVLTIDENGNVLRGGGITEFAGNLYDLECWVDPDIGYVTPFWHHGAYKVYVGGNACETNIKVGINTANPACNLHNVGTSYLSGITGIGGNPTGHNTWVYIESNNSDDAIRYNNASGTQFKVDASGKVVARDIKVTLNSIPDYVFKSDYKLPTLMEQENFIETNGHLRGVPSENEMIKDETTIGELEMINLRLNEEQMLYLIELSKRIDEIEKQNERLNILVKELSSQKE